MSLRIAIISDLHLEMRNDKHAIIRLLDKCMVDADYLFIAGDVVSGRYLPIIFPDFMGALCSKYKGVFYVAGNHEYWWSSFKEIKSLLNDIQVQIPNLYILDNEMCYCDGVTIYGGTLWFERSLKSEAYRPNWPDFAYCSDGYENIYFKSAEFRANFPEADVEPVDIVLTHHMPSNKSIAPYWKGQATNCYFVNPVEDLVEKAKLWIHGHTHTKFDYKHENCRVVCNPLGSPSEQSSKKYKPLILEI